MNEVNKYKLSLYERCEEGIISKEERDVLLEEVDLYTVESTDYITQEFKSKEEFDNAIKNQEKNMVHFNRKSSVPTGGEGENAYVRHFIYEVVFVTMTNETDKKTFSYKFKSRNRILRKDFYNPSEQVISHNRENILKKITGRNNDINKNYAVDVNSFTKTLFSPNMSIERMKKISNRFVQRDMSLDKITTDMIVGKINRPIINKYNDSPKSDNKKSFDVISITVSLVQPYEMKDVNTFKQAIKSKKSEIDKMVKDKIANDKSFQKYGVPVNILKCTRCTLTAQKELVYTFEVKDIPSNKKEE